MHPRTPKDLILNEKQISMVLVSTTWFINMYMNLESQVSEIACKRSLENLVKARIKGIQLGK